jgi:hypothetical protein
MTTLEMAQLAIDLVASTTKPRVGDIYLNPKRGNCLRVNRIGNTTHMSRGRAEVIEMAYCMSFRPDGEKGSQLVSVAIDKLRANYELVTGIKIETPVQTLERNRITGKMELKARGPVPRV